LSQDQGNNYNVSYMGQNTDNNLSKNSNIINEIDVLDSEIKLLQNKLKSMIDLK